MQASSHSSRDEHGDDVAPSIALASKVQVGGDAKYNVVEYCGRNASLPRNYDSEVKCAALARLLSGFGRHSRATAKITVDFEESEDELRYRIRDGSSPTSSDGIGAGLHSNDMMQATEQIHSVLFQKRTRRLVVYAESACARHLYRRLFGRVFWDDESHFCLATRYTARPLVERGAAALGGHGIRELDEVVLTRITFATRGELDVVECRKADIGHLLDSPIGTHLRRHKAVDAFELALRICGRSRPVTVNVQVPSLSERSSTYGHDIVDTYLSAAGFMVLERSVEGAT